MSKWSIFEPTKYKCLFCGDKSDDVLIGNGLEGNPAICSKCLFERLVPNMTFKWKEFAK
jgi:hypothetical protein